MKIIIAGSRDIKDTRMIYKKLNALYRAYPKLEIVSGCAKGPDSIALEFSSDYKIKSHKFPADWNKFGKRAGYIRNEAMADFADGLVAFWDGVSKGTKHMIQTAISKNLKIKIIDQYGQYIKLDREDFK